MSAAALVVASTRVAAHGEAGPASGSPVETIPVWAGLAVALALAALSVALVARRRTLGRRTTRTVGGVAVVLLAGSLLVVATGAAGVGLPGGPTTERPLWVSDTGRAIGGNHHAAAVDGGRVYAPLSGPGTTEGCELVALHGADGGVVWRAPVETNCSIHAVADPAVADTDGDGAREVLVATGAADLRVYGRDGKRHRRGALSDYGYTRPVVADIDGTPGAETVVVDARGTVVVFGPDGADAWRYSLDDYVWARPVVGDVDGDGRGEVFVASRDGRMTLLRTGADGDGATVVWSRAIGDAPGISWLTAGDADGDPALELVVATVDGDVYAVDGASGAVEWRRRFGALASVGGFGDGDGDGAPEVYVADRSGHVRALDAATGETAWETRVTDGAVQMMPPPSLGDTDGDGSPDLVVPAHDGSVSKLDPVDGRIVSRYERTVSADAAAAGHNRVFARATLGDVDGDGDADAVVVYADGTVVALDF